MGQEQLEIELKNFVETVAEMRRAQRVLSGKTMDKHFDPVQVKRLEAAVDVRVGVLLERFNKQGGKQELAAAVEIFKS